MTAILRGTRDHDSAGVPWKRLGHSPYVLEDFDAADFRELLSLEQRNSVMRDITVRKGFVDNIDRVISMPYSDVELDGFLFEDITATDLDRGFMRLKKARNGVIRRVVVQQKSGGSSQFPDAFATVDHPTDNILFEECEAYGFHQLVEPGKYPNGGAFSDEEHSTRHVYRRCIAADGNDGFDLKSKGAVLEECEALNNRRNYRFWGDGTAVDCVSDSPTNAHFWFGGQTRLGDWTLVRPVFLGGGDIPHLTIEAATEGVVITVIDPRDHNGPLAADELKVRQIDSGKLAKVVVRYSDGTEPPVVEPEPPAPPVVEPEPEPEVPDEPGTPPAPEPPTASDPLDVIARAKAEAALADRGGSADKTERMKKIHAILSEPLTSTPKPEAPATRRLSFTIDGVTYVGDLVKE